MTCCPPNGPGGPIHLQAESLDPSGVDAVAALFERVRSGAWSGDALRRELARSDGLALWMRQGSEAAAALLGRVVLDEFHILDVATAAALRRQGFARCLLRQALSEAVRRGCEQAMLELRASNRPARSLYEEAGFVVVGSRPRYYRDGESATLMTYRFGGA